jgi:hypothetical protein
VGGDLQNARLARSLRVPQTPKIQLHLVIFWDRIVCKSTSLKIKKFNNNNMIIVKCLGYKNDVLRFTDDIVSNVEELKRVVSERLCIDHANIIIMLKGKEIVDTEQIRSGMKLIGIIKKSSVKSKIAPPPIEVDEQIVLHEIPKDCIGYPKSCSFYGRKDSDGYCSLCYKRKLRDENGSKRSNNEVNSNPDDIVVGSDVKRHKPSIAPPPVKMSTSTTTQTDLEKCWNCNRRIGLLGFDCKCGYKYCGLHRHPEDHSCTYDYKSMQRELLKKTLSSCAIEQNKVDRI